MITWNNSFTQSASISDKKGPLGSCMPGTSHTVIHNHVFPARLVITPARCFRSPVVSSQTVSTSKRNYDSPIPTFARGQRHPDQSLTPLLAVNWITYGHITSMVSMDALYKQTTTSIRRNDTSEPSANARTVLQSVPDHPGHMTQHEDWLATQQRTGEDTRTLHGMHIHRQQLEECTGQDRRRGQACIPARATERRHTWASSSSPDRARHSEHATSARRSTRRLAL